MQLAEVQAKVQAEVILVRVQTEDARVGMELKQEGQSSEHTRTCFSITNLSNNL